MSSPWRRFWWVVGFEAALLALAAGLGRVTPLLLTIVIGAALIETYRLVRALRAGPAAAPAGPAVTDREGVQGADLPVEGDPWDLDARLVEAGLLDSQGLKLGVVPLVHADELVAFVDIEPSEIDGYDWVVGMHDEVRLFVDDDSLSEVEGDDALESRFTRAQGITRAMREDREIVHVAAPGMTARQLHALAIDVLADAAHATQQLRGEG